MVEIAAAHVRFSGKARLDLQWFATLQKELVEIEDEERDSLLVAPLLGPFALGAAKARWLSRLRRLTAVLKQWTNLYGHFAAMTDAKGYKEDQLSMARALKRFFKRSGNYLLAACLADVLACPRPSAH